MPCLLMKPVLRLRLHATQSQPCFPAASNALALSGGNGIFTATPTERITHYTLLRKVVCQGASPFGNPRQQNRRYATLSGSIPPLVVSSPFHGLRVVPYKLTKMELQIPHCVCAEISAQTVLRRKSKRDRRDFETAQ